jgi:hypothetical protein
VCAAAYVRLGEKMKFLWDRHLKLNTVHVRDVCKAVWHVHQNFEQAKGNIYNLADSGDTTQGILNGHLGNLFNIATGYQTAIVSNLAKVAMSQACSTINDKHLGPWADVCQQHGINNTPLTPFLAQEILYHKHMYVNGTAITNLNGFTYDHPECTEALVEEMVQFAISQGIFPPVLRAGGGAQGGADEEEVEEKEE